MHAAFDATTEELFDTMVNIHLKGTYFLTQKLLPLISDGPAGLLGLRSDEGRHRGADALPGEGARLAPHHRQHLRARRDRNRLRGGAVRDNAQLNAFVASQTALGRAGLPEDIGGAIAALLSNGNGWVNAQRIEASGGMFI